MASPVGQRVGNYRVVKLLGRGGMGAVYLAEQPRIERRVAVKILHPALAAHGDAVQRFFNEALAANRIAHPGIVEVYDCGEHPELGYYMIMEHLEGQTLDELLEQGGVPVATAIEIVQQVARALSAAHAKDVVHRDLKPGNIFVLDGGDGPPQTRVVDFGVAKLLEAPRGVATRAGQVVDTPRYMAPEQFEDARSVDRRADIYALGLIAYRLLCGRGPFDELSGPDLVEAHLIRPPEAPSRVNADLPAALDAVLLRSLAKRPGDRFASATELAEALAGALTPAAAGLPSDGLPADLPALPDTAGATTPTPRPHRRARTLSPMIVPLVTASLRFEAREKEEGAEQRPTVPLPEISGPGDEFTDPGPTRPLPLLAVQSEESLLPTHRMPRLRPGGEDQARERSAPPPWLGRHAALLLLAAVVVGLAVGIGAWIAAPGEAPPGGSLVARSSGDSAQPRRPRDAGAPADRRPPPQDAGLGSLRIIALDRGRMVAARVFVDGREVGVAPRYLEALRGGTRAVEVRLDGYETQARSVELPAGGVRTVIFQLARDDAR